MSDETKLSDEQNVPQVEDRTAGEVEQTEQLRKDAAEAAASAAETQRPDATPAPKPASKEDDTPKPKK